MFKSSSWGNTRYRRKDGWFDGIGLGSTDRMINLRVTIDMSFRFRFALLLCAFIILVNILFKVQTDFVESTIHKQSRAAIYHPSQPRDSDNIPGAMGRDLDGGIAPDLGYRGSDKLARLLQNRNARNRLRQSDEEAENKRVEVQEPHEADDSVAQQGSCRAGHIPGLGNICDSKGCLRKLTGRQKGSTAYRQEPLSEADRRNIDFMPGWLDEAHYDIVPLLTDIQWSEGLYGSVGEMIAGVGKFTSLLTYNVDQSVGELLFVSDDLIGHQRQNAIDDGDKSAYETFVENVSSCGYTVTDITSNRGTQIQATGSKTIYVHKGNVMDLNKDLFQSWDMPQFRLIAIDASEDTNPGKLISSLIISSCILMDGGVLVVNGVDEDDGQNYILHCLSQYFNGLQLSPPVLVPLISARNKIYLTTAGYRQLYTEHLTKLATDRIGSPLLQVTTSKYGRRFTYLTLED